MKLRCLTALAALAAAVSILPAQVDGAPRFTDLLETFACDAGDELEISIDVSPGGAVALQFDLEYDPAVLMFKEATAAPVLTEAGVKMTVSHIAQGLARIVVFGMHLEPLPEGEIGAVVFRAVTDAAATRVHATGRSVPDAEGRNLKSVVRNGTIVVVSKEVSHEDR